MRLPLVALCALLALSGAVIGAGRAAGQAAPTNTAEPRITGTPVVGRTLTASRGTWSGSPTSYAFQWVRCPESGGSASGSNCAAISGATTRSYVLGGSDAGRRLRVRVTASNADGSATVASNATAVVERAGAVTNTAPPTISGSPTVGATLSANPGTWTGSNLSFSYSWRRCDADGGSCAAITDATQKTYLLKQIDQGNTLRVRVVARNDDDSGAATSTPTARITATAPPAPNGCPAGSGTAQAGQVSPPARLLVDRQQISPPVVRRGTDTLTVRFRVVACGGRPVQGALVYATAVPYNQFTVPQEAPTGADGWATLTMGRLRGFPAADKQQLLVIFVRARKNGENVLGGISTRRLVSFPVNLNG
jgi:hypothetical protein